MSTNVRIGFAVWAVVALIGAGVLWADHQPLPALICVAFTVWCVISVSLHKASKPVKLKEPLPADYWFEG